MAFERVATICAFEQIRGDCGGARTTGCALVPFPKCHTSSALSTGFVRLSPLDNPINFRLRLGIVGVGRFIRLFRSFRSDDIVFRDSSRRGSRRRAESRRRDSNTAIPQNNAIVTTAVPASTASGGLLRRSGLRVKSTSATAIICAPMKTHRRCHRGIVHHDRLTSNSTELGISNRLMNFNMPAATILRVR